MAWSEEQVWDIIKKWKINPHPAYQLGWGRVSCMACIFGERNQWTSIRELAPAKFNKIAGYETEFNLFIKKGESVVQQADKGESYLADVSQELKDLSMSNDYPVEKFFVEEWELPKGAFKACGGPPN